MARIGKVRVPATSANIGPGFDTFGIAFQLYNTVTLEEGDGGLEITVSGEGADDIPKDGSNIVYKAIDHVLTKAGYEGRSLRIQLENGVPVERGLGSSAASILGGVLAADDFLGRRFSRDLLLDWAVEIEGHPDNIAPALLGGMIISINDEHDKLYKKIALPERLTAVAVVPEFKLSTKKSREILPAQVNFKDAVFNMRRATIMMVALIEGDLALFGRMMEDHLHHPFREVLVPGMSKVFAAAKKAGAFSVALSGSGSTILAFTEGEAGEIGGAMQAAFAVEGIESRVMALKPDNVGAVLLK